MVERSSRRIFGKAKPTRGISLRVTVNNKSPHVLSSQRRCEIDGGRRLSDTAFLIGNCDYASHVISSKGEEGEKLSELPLLSKRKDDVSRETSPAPNISQPPIVQNTRLLLPQYNLACSNQYLPLPAKGDGYGFPPLEARASSSNLIYLSASNPKAKATAVLQEAFCRWNQRFHPAHRSGGDKIERAVPQQLRSFLDPLPFYSNATKTARPRHFLQEHSLLANRLQQDDLKICCYQLQCQAREPGPTANIKQPPLQRQGFRNQEAFSEVPDNTFRWIGNRRQVDFPVPSQEHFKINEKLINCLVRKAYFKWFKQIPDSLFV